MAVSLALAAEDGHPRAGATGQPTPLGTLAQEQSLPAPDGPLPTAAPALAADLQATTLRLRRAAGAWQAAKPGVSEPLPQDVALLALHQQRLYVRLLRLPTAVARAMLPRLGESVRGEARDTLAARRALAAIPTGKSHGRAPAIRIQAPAPAGRLRGYYAEAQRRFGVRWQLLAAVNLVESAFGRLGNASSAGAQGPMQFLPATWRAYGLGGDIRDPHDAILGAANYLRASGARRDERAALLRYNPSDSYARAVLLHARRIARDPRHFLALYGWEVYVRRGGRPVRVTGPGAR